MRAPKKILLLLQNEVTTSALSVCTHFDLLDVLS